MHLCLQTPFSDGNNATHQWNSTAILFSDSYLLGVPFSILCSFNLFLPLCLGVFVYMRLFFKPSLSVSGHKLLVCVCVCVFNYFLILRCHFYLKVSIHWWHVKELNILERSLEMNIYSHSESSAVYYKICVT